MLSLLGTGDSLLRIVEQEFDVEILVRGNDVTVSGPQPEAGQVVRVFAEFVKLLERGYDLDESLVRGTIEMVRADDDISPADVLGDTALQHRGRAIRPKTPGQKAYLDAIRSNTVVFSIGPAGTGKTYLAMAMAVEALRRKQVNRILLTRWSAARSKSRRWRTCVVARSTTASSCSTRRRTPPPSR
jgi:phosphate starvation-inducible PhoH-like protein